ncbi:MAG: BamA/TamA family outer membrane protein, partial [Polaribacter sp.]
MINCSANVMKKLSYCFLLLLILASCNSTKHVAEGKYLLTKNYIMVDSTKEKSIELQKYVLQKPNSRILGTPLGLYFHNWGNHSNPKIPSKWAEKHPFSYNLIKNIFSEKQSIA